MNPHSWDCDDCNDLRGVSPSIDDTLKILEHPLRRDIVDCCISAPGNIMEIEAVADHLVSAREEVGESVTRGQLLAELHHQHLPMMVERDMIEFDPRSGQLRYRPSDLVERWLRRIQDEQAD